MIHDSAIVDPSVKLGSGVSIGPWSVIGADGELGDNVEIASHVIVKGPSRISRGVKIFQFATVGEATPALAYAGESSMLEIGEHTIIREGVTIHRGMDKGGIGRTEVGSHCLLMAYVHVGHDCIVGDHVIMANNASLAGHVEVGDYANFGGYAGIPQFRKIGAHTHIAAMSMVTKDVPAYMTVSGNPAYAFGMNTEGMKRRGYDAATIEQLKQAYRIVYRKGLRVQEALQQLTPLCEESAEVALFAASVAASAKGIIRGRSAN